ncbi:MAG: hypothetical protein JWO38_2408 [Gemmataceae bacterium]|nr:hypothetical protein [Gemmataceae bacterium]
MTPPTPTGIPPPPSAVGPPGVVLLVEDDDAIRALARRVLEMRGLTVLAAANPGEALRVAAEYPGRVDVMVADVSLPGMDGRELAATVRAGRPDLKVVFISGYPRDEVFGPGRADMRAEFLPKPFTPAKLADLLARLLAAGPPVDPGPAALPTPPGVNDTAFL